ncbi:MAG: ribonuclease Y [Candidatus Dojkabacteria bacterium]|nr:MAG: ribonuclease Y [Candidatus Dojkabacteria bacterium]
MTGITIFAFVLAIVGIVASVYLYNKNRILQKEKDDALNKTQFLSDEEKIKLLDELSAKKIEDAKQEAEKIRQQAQKDAIEIKKSAVELEKSLLEREKILEQKTNFLLEKEKKLDKEEEILEQEKQNLKKERNSIAEKLAEIAGMTPDMAREKLMEDMKSFLEKDFANQIRTYREKLTKESETLAREIIIDAMTSSATDYVAEYTTSVFPVDGEEVKGKIIGKEGRNIKTFEKITGVNLILDESDDYIVISCFDPLRRELAKIALTKLIKDGRINPARIEEYVQKARLEIAKQIIKDGEEIAYKAGFPNLSLEHLKYLGRMKYRFSYGQCLATHVLEVVSFVERAASELGLDVQLAKECALWHDIGKVITHEKEGDHMQLGEEIGIKLKLRPEVINAMYAHHMAKDPVCMESALVYIADANSAARPGARYGNVEDYVKRIKALEEIAKKYEGVKEAYAVEAGREVRVFVDPVIMNDDAIIILSNDIAKEIESTQTYPGIVKVTVIREIRATATAK